MIWEDGKLLSPGKILPGDLVFHGMRVWQPHRSKVAALYFRGEELPIHNERILYLGAAAGTTVSFLGDYAEVVYAVEFSERPVRNLVRLARQRSNIIPIFQDARYPERYLPFVEPVDVLVQDIAQRDQVEIAIKNLPMLKFDGYFLLFLKMLSMGIAMSTDEKIGTAIRLLETAGIVRMKVIGLEGYHAGHVAVVGINQSRNNE